MEARRAASDRPASEKHPDTKDPIGEALLREGAEGRRRRRRRRRRKKKRKRKEKKKKVLA